MSDLLITDDLLSEMLERRVCWHEVVIPIYIRCHFDQRRYLSEYIDIPIRDVNVFMQYKEIKENETVFIDPSLNLFPPHVIVMAVGIGILLLLYLMIYYHI